MADPVSSDANIFGVWVAKIIQYSYRIIPGLTGGHWLAGGFVSVAEVG
jgi:hypothetical protein